MNMKKLTLALAGLLALASAAAAAPDKDAPVLPDTYEYDTLVASIRGVSEPHVSGDFLVFTADKSARSVGIAFDYEDYKVIHPFNLHKSRNFEGEVTDSWWFFVTTKPKKIRSVSYRLVIDGLWTTDPNNPDVVFDEREGITMSRLKIPAEDPAVTETLASGQTHFVCFAKPGQNIRLGGTFTNWDSWIYTMREVEPGRYELDVPLPEGTYYYAYFVGMTRFIDTTNPRKGYSADGKVVSCISVEIPSLPR